MRVVVSLFLPHYLRWFLTHVLSWKVLFKWRGQTPMATCIIIIYSLVMWLHVPLRFINSSLKSERNIWTFELLFPFSVGSVEIQTSFAPANNTDEMITTSPSPLQSIPQSASVDMLSKRQVHLINLSGLSKVSETHLDIIHYLLLFRSFSQRTNMAHYI